MWIWCIWVFLIATSQPTSHASWNHSDFFLFPLYNHFDLPRFIGVLYIYIYIYIYTYIHTTSVSLLEESLGFAQIGGYTKIISRAVNNSENQSGCGTS